MEPQPTALLDCFQAATIASKCHSPVNKARTCCCCCQSYMASGEQLYACQHQHQQHCHCLAMQRGFLTAQARSSWLHYSSRGDRAPIPNARLSGAILAAAAWCAGITDDGNCPHSTIFFLPFFFFKQQQHFFSAAYEQPHKQTKQMIVRFVKTNNTPASTHHQ